jgi:histidinol-phosphate aminotransferase
MENSMNRRDWIKASTLLGGTLALTGSMGKLTAAPKLKAPQAYQSQRDFEEKIAREWPDLKARLYANENPFGPSEKAKKAIEEAVPKSYQYPIQNIDKLVKMIAEVEGVKPEQVLMSAGSSPLLHAAAIYFTKSGGSIMSGDPSYDDLPHRAETLQGKWIKVPVTDEYKLDLPAMEKAITSDTTLVYICNPNNPTGTVLDADQLKSFCERVSKKVTVMVDEAYIDYLDDPHGSSVMSCVRNGQNVIVARTFSKLHGFAGLRVGYIISQPETIKKLQAYATGPWALSATSLNGAITSYPDKEFLAEALKKTKESKEYLYSVLKKEGYSYIPAAANFVMFPLNMEAERFVGEMMKRGVGVRPWKFRGKEWCRVSIGRMDEMKYFEEAFKQIS